MTQTFTTQHLSEEAIERLVNYLPDYIKVALLEKSALNLNVGCGDGDN
jgi:hypothetical protein